MKELITEYANLKLRLMHLIKEGDKDAEIKQIESEMGSITEKISAELAWDEYLPMEEGKILCINSDNELGPEIKICNPRIKYESLNDALKKIKELQAIVNPEYMVAIQAVIDFVEMLINELNDLRQLEIMKQEIEKSRIGIRRDEFFGL